MITRETENDSWEVEALYDLCFAPDRRSLSSYRLRHNVEPVPDLSFIWRQGIALTGAIRYWPVNIAGESGLLLGPVAVHPTAQGEGVGSALIHHSLAAARLTGWSRVILIGDEPYYKRFGFTRAPVTSLDFPPPTNKNRFLGLALHAGAFDGLSGAVCSVRES